MQRLPHPTPRPVGRLLAAIVVTLVAAGGTARATAPVLVSAVSRMTHGSAGTFDVQLPLTGGTGIECRSVANGLKVVMTFDQPVTGGTVAVTAGTATAAGPTLAGNTMAVVLSGVADAQAVTVTASGVTNAGGETLASAAVPLRTLYGDVNGDGAVTGSDLNAVQAAVTAGGAVTGGTFRCDVNVDGALATADVSLEQAAVAAGGSVAGGPTANTPPTITQVANQTVVTGTAMSPVGFTVADAESDPSTLVVTWTSSDPVTIPNANIAVTGTGASRAVTLTPAAGITAVVPVTVTLYVSDGLAYSAPMAFTVNVTPPPTTYLATLGPVAGTGSLATGSAVLTVSGDQTYAVLSIAESNLSSNDTDDSVYDASGGVLYDVPVGRARGDLQPDGTLRWTFGAAKTAAILADLQSNTAYFLTETATNPAGELTGTFKLISGSQTFTPPAAPPAITINPPTPADASRFLQQAAFGGTGAEIAALSNPAAANASTALNDWLTAQFNTALPVAPTYAATAIAPGTTAYPATPQSAAQPYTTSSTYYQLYNRLAVPQNANGSGDLLADDRMHEVWWRNAVKAPDSLRQRIATAYSEVFVVSELDSTIDQNIPGLCSYYDMLADDAFVNFRQLLADVTLHPVMGNYLNMKGNTKAIPNENYAREVMQLFTVGLYMLQPDGTLMLDGTGKPIPTYNQATVTSMAQVYTGWDQKTYVTIPTLPAPIAPATMSVPAAFYSQYQLPMTVTASNHSTGAKTLLAYPGVATIGSAATPGTIAANASQTATTATAELNAALDNIFNHPNVGPFVCRQLIQRLVESNPSPAYVYRVAQVFANDGTGVRGNMQAVIAAILTDYEARSPAVQSNVGYGHAREPIVRMAQLLHACNAVSKTAKFTVGKSDGTLAQTIFRAPTVFNFFDPAYGQPGVVQSAGLASPELELVYASTISNAQNIIYTTLYSATYNADGSPALSGAGFRCDAFGSDVYLDFSAATGSGLLSLAQGTGGSAAMLNQVVLLLNGGPLDATGAAQARIQQFLNTLPNTNPLAQVQAAVHLVATSAQCATQK